MKVAVLASFDSFLRAGVSVASALGCDRSNVHAYSLPTRLGHMSQRQVHDAGITSAQKVDFASFLSSAALDEYDLIIPSLSNALFRRFMSGARVRWQSKARRPLFLGCYPGIIFGDPDSLLSRSSADLHLVNSQYDLTFYRALCSDIGLPSDNGIHFGLPTLHGVSRRDNVDLPPRTVLFAEQVVVPETRGERLALLTGLVAYAQRYQERNILLKPRAHAKETSVHDNRYPLVELLRRNSVALPPNLKVVWDPVSSLLDKSDLCLTVSSTVAIEAMARGIPVALLGDFGISRALRNVDFVGSGCTRTFAMLERDRLPELSTDWYSQHVASPDDAASLLKDRVMDLLAQQACNGRSLPVPTCAHQALTGGLEGILEPQRTDKWRRKLRKLRRDPRRFISDAGRNALDTWRKRRS